MSLTVADVLPASRCALVVVDVQNDYCDPDGALARAGGDMSQVAPAVDAISALLDVARAAGAPCLHVRTEHSDWTDTPEWLARGDAGNLLDPRHHPIVRQGSWGAQPYRISAAADERVVVKHRYSGFAYTSLELSLRARGRQVVLLAGVTSDLCVRATGFDALARGFQPVLVADATAATSRARHDSAVTEFRSYLGPVVTVADVQAAWSRPETASAASAEPAARI